MSKIGFQINIKVYLINLSLNSFNDFNIGFLIGSSSGPPLNSALHLSSLSLIRIKAVIMLYFIKHSNA
ncbi:membrane protein insertion efficiency factor YidD [Borrelia miyamotoi]|nr:membrane protein insertion efficiency factor YidD [Borrelia miyamotoi]